MPSTFEFINFFSQFSRRSAWGLERHAVSYAFPRSEACRRGYCERLVRVTGPTRMEPFLRAEQEEGAPNMQPDRRGREGEWERVRRAGLFLRCDGHRHRVPFSRFMPSLGATGQTGELIWRQPVATGIKARRSAGEHYRRASACSSGSWSLVLRFLTAIDVEYNGRCKSIRFSNIYLPKNTEKKQYKIQNDSCKENFLTINDLICFVLYNKNDYSICHFSRFKPWSSACWWAVLWPARLSSSDHVSPLILPELRIPCILMRTLLYFIIRT